MSYWKVGLHSRCPTGRCACPTQGYFYSAPVNTGDEGKERPNENTRDSESEGEKGGRVKWRREGGSSGVGKVQ